MKNQNLSKCRIVAEFFYETPIRAFSRGFQANCTTRVSGNYWCWGPHCFSNEGEGQPLAAYRDTKLYYWGSQAKIRPTVYYNVFHKSPRPIVLTKRGKMAVVRRNVLPEMVLKNISRMLEEMYKKVVRKVSSTKHSYTKHKH